MVQIKISFEVNELDQSLRVSLVVYIELKGLTKWPYSTFKDSNSYNKYIYFDSLPAI